ncbi:unnamed protein product, partial [Vitis vinifera]|uniref:Uncharacterized protein n=1 Tax=Vitis vinifera TaxID=29760 RepID=D7U2W5_VITVI
MTGVFGSLACLKEFLILGAPMVELLLYICSLSSSHDERRGRLGMACKLHSVMARWGALFRDMAA